MKFLVGMAMLALGASAIALPEFWETFEKHYQLPADSALAQGKCLACHTNKAGGARNAYGKDIERLLDNSDTLTAEILVRLEEEDSDDDGVPNLKEIEAGTMPGDPASGGTKPVEETASAPLVPTHSFHPLFVHFPIALFLFGGALDFWGKLRRSDEVRRAAFIALLVGGLASLPAVISGILAWQRMELTLAGTLQTHLVLGLVTSAFMLVIVLWRRRSALDSPLYWILLLLTMVAVAVTGHLGSDMVWG